MFTEKILKKLIENIHSFSNRNAFCIDDTYYTYEEFGKIISKIRKALSDSNLLEKNIGLVVNDDIETYASIFALWMEGKCYVPLHPNQPLDRCVDIMSQIDSKSILDSSSETRYFDYNVIETSKLNEVADSYFEDLKGLDDDLAYILFTSGSTGKPKGVMLSRKNLTAFVDSYFALGYQITEEDRCLQCFDLTFDLSVGSYIIPMLKGACSYTVPLDVIKYSKVYELFEDYELTSALMVPSTIRYLEPYFDEINLPKLRYCLFCGEALYVDIIEKWKKCIPNAVIDNVYGPTEDTIYCSAYRCGDNIKNHNGVICIGKAMKNSELIIVDEDSNVIEGSDHGELCLAGDQLTQGYVNNPEKNKEAFFMLGSKRYYRTGDICYRDSDGDFMYVGRKDSQAKIQGFRVELSEVEFHAKEYLKGRNLVALAYTNDKHLTEIVMFIEGSSFDVSDLTEYMRSKMPSYMIPSRILFEPTFPLNVNGKTDKVRLKTLIK